MEKVRQAMQVALNEWERDDPVDERRDNGLPVNAPQTRTPAQVRSSTQLRLEAQKASEAIHEKRAAPPHARFAKSAQAPSTGPVPIKISPETLARNRLVAGITESPEREAYCLLQSGIWAKMSATGLNILGVTSPRGTSGKTLTAVNLAISLALTHERTVILIDLDFEHPSIHRRFGQEPSVGIEQCLFGNVDVSDALFAPGLGSLVVLPSRRESRQSTQILRSPDLQVLLTQLKKLYPDSLLVLDCPAVTSTAESEALSNLVDAMLLVAEHGVTKESDFRWAVESLRKSILLGTVLNRAELTG